MDAICNFLKENNSFHIEIISASGQLADDMMKNCLAIASITEKNQTYLAINLYLSEKLNIMPFRQSMSMKNIS